MFVWDEVIAKRGSVEVANCLSKYLNLHHDENGQTSLFLLSDNCPGQNMNINLSLMLRLIHSKYFFYDPPHVPCPRSFLHAL